MKKSCILLGITMLMMLTACGETGTEEATEYALIEDEVPEYLQEDSSSQEDNIQEDTIEDEVQGEEGIDVDLTILSATMVYAEVYSMYVNPDEYIGKIVKMQGSFSVEDIPMAGMLYFSVIIEDALGCCAQGIEFELEGDYSYPSDYPEIGAEITVVGEFETYYEGEMMYCRLKNAVIQ